VDDIDETNPPTREGQVVLINGDTEIFVAPRPRIPKPATASSPAGKKSEEKRSTEKEEPKSRASIRQVVAPTVPTASVVASSSTQTYQVPKVNTEKVIRARTIPLRIFSQWEESLVALRETIRSDTIDTGGKRWIIWTSKNVLRRIQPDEKGRWFVDVHPPDDPKSNTDITAAQPREGEEDGAKEDKLERKRRKAVLLPLSGIPDGHVFVWPLWGEEGDVDTAWKLKDWACIR
jgi:hypothetical protein